MKNSLKNIYKNSTILIVDDAPEYIDMLSSILKNYEKKIALTGEAAIKIANTDPKPSLILLDILMPKMDGFEVLRILRENPKTISIPVIFITALNETTDIIKGLEMGAVDYITKPFYSAEVLCRVNTHLSYAYYCKKIENINLVLEEEVKNRTAELKYAKEKAEESNRLKSHFLSLVSHELRTPMVGIMGYSEILKEELVNHPVYNYVENLIESSERLFETLTSILALSKLEYNKQSIKITEFDFIKRIKSLLQMHEIKAAQKGLEIILKVNVENDITQLDKTKFDIIFNNIVNNAIKYTSKGKVEIEVYNKFENSVKYNVIEIVDTGIGIPDDAYKKIFEEFRQVDEGTGRKFDGVGLGLSLVKKYVDSLNGKVELESQVGKGSKFIISLPCYLSFDDFATKKIEQNKNNYKSLADKKLKLLIFKNSDNELDKESLDNFGNYKIVTSIEEIINALNSDNFGCILVDIDLEKNVAIDKEIQILRSIKKASELPIIAFTEFEQEDERLNLLKIGYTYVISKSDSNENIKDIIYGSSWWGIK